MTATELLPCPFCGRPAKVESWWSDKEECGVAFARCTKESYVNGPECAQIWVMRVERVADRFGITPFRVRSAIRRVRAGRYG